MSEAKVNYYEVLVDTPMHELDEANGFAFPIKSENGNKWIVKKGQYVKSFGQLRSLKNTNKAKETYLLLVNGNGVNLKDVTLFKDEVDDCGCDMMPIAKPTDLEKLKEYNDSLPKESNNAHKKLDKNSAYKNKKEGFDKSGLIGFLLGAIIVGGFMWFKTKDKKKAIIGAIAGAFLGMVIGYLIGRRGTKKIAEVKNIEKEISKVSEDNKINEDDESNSESQEFLQLGQEYSFSIPYPIYATVYSDNAFYVARDKENNKIMLDANKIVRGKLVEVKEPQLFIVDVKNKKVIKVKNKKPLPFVEIGNNLFIPLALTDKTSMISTEDAMRYLDGENNLDNEIYIKGRYSGKRNFFMMYVPNHEETIRKKYGK